MNFDIKKIREDFPILEQKVYDKTLVYFDNGATAQKPRRVIERINSLYADKNSSIHRGIHLLSEEMTQAYEDARTTVQKFINAKSDKEIVFTNGTTASINNVAFSFGEKYIKQGDEILVSEMEHHANIVPWQMLCERKNATLKVIPINDKGEILMDEYKKLLNPHTKLVAVAHVSNALGTRNPIEEIIALAHAQNTPVLIDGAQSVMHEDIDVQKYDCDFFVFSGHKLYGPTGIGVLYGKTKWLEAMPPYMGGGDMVDRVTFEKTTYNEIPFKFEAGTTNFIGAIGMAEAIKYIESIGIENIAAYEHELLKYATEKLLSIEGLIIYGQAENKSGLISFLIEGIHQYDIGMILDKLGIAVRTGTHCAQPVMARYEIDGTVRASFSFYNTKEEVDKLYEALLKIKEMFL